MDYLGFHHKLTESGKVVSTLNIRAKKRLKKKIKFLKKLKAKSFVDEHFISVRLESFRAHMAKSNSFRMRKNLNLALKQQK